MAKKVFIIDDEPNMTELVSVLLKYKGFEVESANDAEQAIEQLLKGAYDAVILDLMMPRLDGFSIIGRLRDSALHARTPILALSAKALDDEERKRLLTSSVRFVSKPVSPTRLVEIVRDSVGG